MIVEKKLSKVKIEQEQPVEESKQQLAYNPPNEEKVELQEPATVEINNPGIEQPKMKDDIVFDNKMYKENINTVLVTNPVVETPDNSSKPEDATANGTENKKFRGFFRKATRILERTTSINAADDDKVLIGGMAINLK